MEISLKLKKKEIIQKVNNIWRDRCVFMEINRLNEHIWRNDSIHCSRVASQRQATIRIDFDNI